MNSPLSNPFQKKPSSLFAHQVSAQQILTSQNLTSQKMTTTIYTTCTINTINTMGNFLELFESLPEKYRAEVIYLVEEVRIKYEKEIEEERREKEKLKKKIHEMEDKKGVDIPIIGVVRHSSQILEEIEEKMAEIPTSFLKRDSSFYFLIKVEGQALIECEIAENSLILVQKTSFASQGDVVVAEIEKVGKMVFKWRKNPKTKVIDIIPCDPNFEVMKVDESKLSIIGVVIYNLKSF